MLDVPAAEQKEVEALRGSRVWVVPEDDSNLYNSHNSFRQIIATFAEVTQVLVFRKGIPQQNALNSSLGINYSNLPSFHTLLGVFFGGRI